MDGEMGDSRVREDPTLAGKLVVGKSRLSCRSLTLSAFFCAPGTRTGWLGHAEEQIVACHWKCSLAIPSVQGCFACF